MKKVTVIGVFFFLLVFGFFYSCSKENGLTNLASLANQTSVGQFQLKKGTVDVTVTSLASDLAFPRGLKFGPDGYLYVSLAGTGGTTSTAGMCPDIVAPPVQSLGGYTASLIKVSSTGNVTTVVDKLPSALNGFGDVLGLADVEFVGNSIYGLVVAGCTHGNIDVPSSVVKMDPQNNSWTVIADMSTYLHNNPAFETEPDDFEPDGSAYSMVNVRGDLYVIEAPWRLSAKTIADTHRRARKAIVRPALRDQFAAGEYCNTRKASVAILNASAISEFI